MNGRVSVETTFLTCFLFWDGGAEVGSSFFAVVALHGLLDSVGGGGGDSIGRLPFLVFLWVRGTSFASSAKASHSSSASFPYTALQSIDGQSTLCYTAGPC